MDGFWTFLDVQPTGFANGWNVRYKNKREIKNDSKAFSLNNWKAGVAICWIGIPLVFHLGFQIYMHRSLAGIPKFPFSVWRICHDIFSFTPIFKTLASLFGSGLCVFYSVASLINRIWLLVLRVFPMLTRVRLMHIRLGCEPRSSWPTL